ncbi:hypothetical protein [Micromonospora sp. HUAS LYJ1]|uniref:hypothetical protein n=1 Tax=Micromonospora sp. HUAS LYJ1 TaxID=3061626 RepID=UPI00267332C0|nr:hypothetical protein [Micromonospora sp. HUAS LYJ1]WKU03744.1 hypothetical protein Q2K16_23310 [Micromonospora sp. HUAS LYJ1]
MKGIIAGPSPDIAPVEALFDGLVDGGFERAMVRCELEPGDLEKLAAGGHVWLVFAGPIPVFGLAVTPPTE